MEGQSPTPGPISKGFPATEETSPVLLIKIDLFKVFFKGVCLYGTVSSIMVNSFGISIQDKLFFQILQNPESRSQGAHFSSIVLYTHGLVSLPETRCQILQGNVDLSTHT